MGDHHDAIFKKVDSMVRPILESNAKRFRRQLSMTYAEALQEARFGLLLALRKYDYNDSRGGIFNFAKVAVRRHFLKVLAAESTQARRPHVHFTQEQSGKVVRVALPIPFVEQRSNVARKVGGGRAPSGTSRSAPSIAVDGGVPNNIDFMDVFVSAAPAPDAALLEADARTLATEFQVALEDSLSERDRAVLRCKHDPPLALRMLMLDELAEEPTIPLIGRYLGLSKNEVDWAIRRIREAAIELIGRDFSDLTHLSVVQAYMDRKP